jgi:hypothetical protein
MTLAAMLPRSGSVLQVTTLLMRIHYEGELIAHDRETQCFTLVVGEGRIPLVFQYDEVVEMHVLTKGDTALNVNAQPFMPSAVAPSVVNVQPFMPSAVAPSVVNAQPFMPSAVAPSVVNAQPFARSIGERTRRRRKRGKRGGRKNRGRRAGRFTHGHVPRPMMLNAYIPATSTACSG